LRSEPILNLSPRESGECLYRRYQKWANRVLEVGERIRELVEKLRENEEGQGMVEYALILVLISIVVIVILSTLGKTVNNVFSNVSHGLSS